jgi:hypothetical protein
MVGCNVPYRRAEPLLLVVSRSSHSNSVSILTAFLGVSDTLLIRLDVRRQNPRLPQVIEALLSRSKTHRGNVAHVNTQ